MMDSPTGRAPTDPLFRQLMQSTSELASPLVMSKVFGITPHQAQRVQALLRLGLTEQDLLISERYFEARDTVRKAGRRRQDVLYSLCLQVPRCRPSKFRRSSPHAAIESASESFPGARMSATPRAGAVYHAHSNDDKILDLCCGYNIYISIYVVSGVRRNAEISVSSKYLHSRKLVIQILLFFAVSGSIYHMSPQITFRGDPFPRSSMYSPAAPWSVMERLDRDSYTWFLFHVDSSAVRKPKVLDSHPPSTRPILKAVTKDLCTQQLPLCD